MIHIINVLNIKNESADIYSIFKKQLLKWDTIHTRVAKIEKDTIPCCKGCEETETLILCRWAYTVQSIEDDLVVTKLDRLLLHNPTVTLLGIYPRKLKTCTPQKFVQDILHSLLFYNLEAAKMFFSK